MENIGDAEVGFIFCKSMNAIIKINEQATTGDEAGKEVVVSVEGEEEADGFLHEFFTT